MPDHFQEIALYFVRSGASAALAAALLRHGAQLLESFTPEFIEECNDEDFDELAEEFAPYTNAMALVLLSAYIISRVFDDED
jgi:hypothetical protein